MSMKRLISLLLALAMAAACLGLSLAEETAAETEAAETVPAEADTVLCTVNGEPITLAQAQKTLQMVIDYYADQGYDLSGTEAMATARQIAMFSEQQSAVMEQKAAELGVDQLSDEDMARLNEDNGKMWEEAIQSYIDYMGNVTEETTEEEMAVLRANAVAYYEAAGFTLQSTLESAIYSETLSRLQETVTGDITVTDEEVQTRFDDMVAADREQYADAVFMYEYMTMYYGQEAYYRPEGYRGVQHILLQVDEDILQTYTDLAARFEEQGEASGAGEDDMDGEAENAEPAEEPVTWEQVEAARQAVLASVQPTVDEIVAAFNNGTPFLDLVDKYGTDPGMLEEAMRTEGYQVHADSIMYDPAFVEGTFSIDAVGGISEPVIGASGVHIIYYLNDVPGGAVELTDALREEIRTGALEELRDARFNELLEQWMDEAEIEYTEAGLDWKPADLETPAEEAPAEETPAEETPAEETPAEETPAEETPADAE